MTCSLKGAFENAIGSTGFVGNFGYDSPYSSAASDNAQYGKLTGGQLTASFPPLREYQTMMTKPWWIRNGFEVNTNAYDDEYNDHTVKMSPVDADGKVDEVAAEQQESKPISQTVYQGSQEQAEAEAEGAAEVDEILNELSTDEQSAIEGQAVVNEDGQTVSTAVEPEGFITNSQYEAFEENAQRRIKGGRQGKFTTDVSNGNVYVAQSKRAQTGKENWTRINGLADSQYLNSTERYTRLPLQNQQDQDQVAALSIVAIAICCIVITWLLMKTCNYCCRAKAQQQVQPVATVQSLQGGSVKPTKSTTLSGGHIF